MTRGRKTMGAGVADTLSGSEVAQQRLRLILATLGGEMTVGDACTELGVSEARFHRLRRDFLEDSIGLLEPKMPGRKRKEPTPEEERITELERERKTLMIELEASRIRTELALVMPHVLKDRISVESKKKDAPNNSKRKRKKRRRR